MPITRLSRLAATTSLAALLAGCATGPQFADPNAAVGAYRDTIALTGRLAVTYQKDGQPQSINGNFTWNQQPGRVDVALASPLGQTMAAITVTPGSATLTQANKPPREARDIDTLTAQTLGWELPVAGLRDWLQGYATGKDGKRFVASPAANYVVTNDGWRLRFVSWQDNATTPMPRRIDAERSATSVGDDLAIRIVIDPVAP